MATSLRPIGVWLNGLDWPWCIVELSKFDAFRIASEESGYPRRG